MLSIGEFSLATRFTVKALRYYHELGILCPRRIDSVTGYRFYDQENLHQAQRIGELKQMGFTLAEMKAILQEDSRDWDDVLQSKESDLDRKIRQMEIQKDRIRRWRRDKTPEEREGFPIEEKTIPPLPYLAAILRGRYDEIGSAFGQLYRDGRAWLTGPSFVCYYDLEFRENDALMEAGSAFTGQPDAEGLVRKELPGGRTLSLLHKGPYDSLGESYNRLFLACRERNYSILNPHRLFFLNNPASTKSEDYLTEIQLFVR